MMHSYNVKKILLKNCEQEDKVIILGESNNFILCAYFYADYILDGYRVYDRSHIVTISTDKETEITELVLRLRDDILLEPIIDLSVAKEDLIQQIITKHDLVELIVSETIFFARSIVSNTPVFIDEEGNDTPGVPVEYGTINSIHALGFSSNYSGGLFLLVKNKKKIVKS